MSCQIQYLSLPFKINFSQFYTVTKTEIWALNKGVFGMKVTVTQKKRI